MTGELRPDLSALTPGRDLRGDSPKDTALLKQLHERAAEYLSSQSWCGGLAESYFAFGVGGVFGIFLFKVVPRGQADEWVWTITGDLPSAYLDVLEIKNAADALSAYCVLMREWASAVIERRDLGGQFPVDAEPTPNNAKALLLRVDFLEKEFLPSLRDSVSQSRTKGKRRNRAGPRRR